MYDRVAIEMLDELAKRTVFSKSVLEKLDAQEFIHHPSRLPARWLRKLQRKVAVLTGAGDTSLPSGICAERD